ncbi:MAG TPA: protein kinase, partial [Candidatus Syntrophosphaera sp.]|nr:protein kinase [Candidatus Syntrophosphaera sp.]
MTTTLGILNDRYQLEQTLGTGGMAIVYKAKDLMLERYVAVKALREDFSQDVAFRERFRQEAKAAANLSHPNIVTVHDFGLDQKHLFIVMEYMPGTDLKTLIKQKERFSVSEALELMIQACSGVGYAHRAGLVHCDIKPHNMLVTPEGRLKVTDFGIARALSTISPDERSEVVWGSPHYFSPEQASGLPPSPASDVYSLGVILYEMLAGRLPFIASDSAELARMHREDLPVAPRYFNTSIPAKLEEIILKVLSKEPSARYRTADQLGRLLMGLYETERSVPFTNENLQQLPKLELVRPNPVPAEEPPARTPTPVPAKAFTPPAPEKTPPRGVISSQPSPLQAGIAESDLEERAKSPIDWKTWSLGLLAAALLLGL